MALLFFINCGGNPRIAPGDEETTYLLVGTPCAEGDYATAVYRADSLLNSPIEMSDSLKAYIMIDRDVALLESGQTERAFAYADTIIDFGHRHGIGLAVMQGLQNQGIINRRKGNWDEAITLYKRGMEIAVKENDMEMQQVFAEMLSIACAEHGLTAEAYNFGTKSVEMARKMGDSIQELNAVSTLGGILEMQGKYAQTVAELLPYIQRSKNIKGVLRVKYLAPIVKSYFQLDSLERAREILAEIYAALDGVPRNTQAYLVAVNTEAILAAKEGRYADQWKWLTMADSIGNMGTLPDQLYIERARCLAHLHRYEEAYEMQVKATAAVDSLRSSDNDEKLSELMVKYDTLQKDNAIDRKSVV